MPSLDSRVAGQIGCPVSGTNGGDDSEIRATATPTSEPVNEWRSSQHALAYLDRADQIPHRSEGEGVLLDFVPRDAARILDLGTGNGRLITLLQVDRRQARFVAVDFSHAMLAMARTRFGGDSRVDIVEHDLDDRLPAFDPFDAIVSCFAIHHVSDRRKRVLYQEVHSLLKPGGVFCNLDHVQSPTPRLRERFWRNMGTPAEEEDPSNQLLDPETQLRWLRQIGFDDVDCAWKWLELALLVGRRLPT